MKTPEKKITSHMGPYITTYRATYAFRGPPSLNVGARFKVEASIVNNVHLTTQIGSCNADMDDLSLSL
jgi:hypothetical protein